MLVGLSQDGKLSGTIHNIGQGPGEYLSIVDFKVNGDDILHIRPELKNLAFQIFNSNVRLVFYVLG